MSKSIRLICLIVLCAMSVLAQGTNATLSGRVVDAAGALMPGVKLTLENVQTGVRFTSSTNETGLYQFQSIQPGLYRLTAERPAFQTLVYNNLVLEVSAQVNLALEIAQIRETVQVTADLDSTLAAATPSVGGVINGMRISDLPRSDRDALGLVSTQAGIVDSNFAGARKLDVNVTRDGINVMNQISNRGVNSVIQLSTDLVDEIRVITSPADAELGRGSGQVQISTRSGTNEFHGSLFESHRNTALNANTFFNNQRGTPRDSLIRNQFGGRIGGPIVKNKTFFHFLFDAQREVTKNTTTAMVYTATAREGIFRFFPGVQNGNFNAAVPTVDINGNPLKPSAATGDLQSLNVFGKDTLRPVMDPTGTVQSMLDLTPLPNNFRVGDGLNSGGHTWNRRATSDRDQYNIKIDHHFSDRYRFNFNWTHQELSALNGYAPQTFPQSPGGSATDDTDFFSVQLTATLSSTLINEFRAGSHLERGRSYAPWELEGKAFLPTTSGTGYMPLFAALANFFPTPNNVFPPGSFPAGSNSSLTVFGDTLSWASGRHTFRFGGEVRLGKGGNSFVDVFVTPQANFGAGSRAVTGLNVQGIGTNQAAAQNLLINLSGSLQTLMQRFYATSGASPVFAGIPEGKHAAADIFQREFSVFFKDDWNVRRGLTLNAGIRYEYYGVPWMIDVNTGEGKTPAVVGGSNGLFGLSGSNFEDLYQPGHLTGTLTRIEFVGPHSPNPGRQLYNPDRNNFAPTIGLTWRIPYFGAEETVLRAGYGVGFEKLPLFIVGNTTGSTPGLVAQTAFTSPQYLDLTRMSLPLTPVGAPLDPVPLTSRSQSIAVFDSNLRTGYVQNWSLSVQRQLPARMSVDVRYIGSKGTKLVRQIDINEANIFESGILDAFVLTQAGGNSPMLEQIFNGLNLGSGTVNGTTITGSQSLRLNNPARSFLANNNVGGFANFLNTSPLGGAPGDLLRRANLPENLIVGNPQFGNLQTGSGTARIASNLANSTYHAMEIELNKRFSGGWTLQSSYTWSRTIGEHAGDSDTLIEQFYRNGRNRHLDKRLLPFHRTHAFKANGTFELPFGPNKRFLGGSTGLLSRIAERWQFGTILSLFSGQPISFVSQTSSFNQYTNNTPNLVAGLPKGFGNVTHDDVGVLYFSGLKIVPDPAVANLTTQDTLNQASLMQAVADAGTNSLIAVNPAPGTLGNMYPAYLEGPGQVRLDVNLVKRIRISETTEFEFRADAIDLLNRPNFANPNTDINSPNFGRITETNGGNRIIVLNARINF